MDEEVRSCHLDVMKSVCGFHRSLMLNDLFFVRLVRRTLSYKCSSLFCVESFPNSPRLCFCFSIYFFVPLYWVFLVRGLWLEEYFLQIFNVLFIKFSQQNFFELRDVLFCLLICFSPFGTYLFYTHYFSLSLIFSSRFIFLILFASNLPKLLSDIVHLL